MTDFFNNVFRIKTSNYNHGCGFIWNNYFITAGHVINQSEYPYIEVEGKRIDLVNPIVCIEEKEDTGYDLAVFKLPDIFSSPLLLIEELPEQGSILTNYSIQEEVVDGGELDYVPLSCTAEASNFFEGNYYSILTTKNLKAGCSGSPVLLGNCVMGLIVFGNNNGDDTCSDNSLPLNYCVVLSSKSIMEKMRSLNNLV